MNLLSTDEQQSFYKHPLWSKKKNSSMWAHTYVVKQRDSNAWLELSE